jgi:hypothetical protein
MSNSFSSSSLSKSGKKRRIHQLQRESTQEKAQKGAVKAQLSFKRCPGLLAG